MKYGDLTSIQSKHILLDTNILIDSSKYPDEFAELYQLLADNNVQAVQERTVRLEFIRYATTLAKKKEFESFLDEVIKEPLMLTQDINRLYGVAEKIALIIARIENTKIELGDCFISAQVAMLNSDVFVATQNHTDFPACIFDRVFLLNIELKENNKIKTICFYKFNKKSYEDLCFTLLKDADPYCKK